jgi:hypothetical protein
MDVLTTIGLGMIGFLIGNLAFSRVGHWVVALHQIAKDDSVTAKTGKIASVTLLSAGPWFVVAVAVFAYFVHSESWSTPIFIGAFVAIAFFSALAVHFARKARHAKADAT